MCCRDRWGKYIIQRSLAEAHSNPSREVCYAGKHVSNILSRPSQENLISPFECPQTSNCVCIASTEILKEVLLLRRPRFCKEHGGKFTPMHPQLEIHSQSPIQDCMPHSTILWHPTPLYLLSSVAPHSEHHHQHIESGRSTYSC